MPRTKLKNGALIASLILMWGLSWPVQKVGLNYMPPLLFAGVRTVTGGFILLLFALRRGRVLHWRRTWSIYLISAFLNVVLFFGLQTISLGELPSGLVSVIVYLQPILVGVLAWLWLGEKLNLRKGIGLILGFLGVVAVSLEGLSGHLAWSGFVYGLLAAVGWAVGTVYVKRVQNEVDLIWLVALQFLIGGAVTTGLGSLLNSWSLVHLTATLWWSMAYSAAIGVALSWLVWMYLLRAGEASRVAAATFFVPLLSVALGTWLLHEPLSIFLLLGLALMVVSIYLVNQNPWGKSKPDIHPVGTCHTPAE
ncbi:DMT family transporter [Alicyclobacillaceae bacterium I2511]|nr:DMT family transporter [Alicyclobacillaceae bacterium I2511]